MHSLQIFVDMYKRIVWVNSDGDLFSDNMFSIVTSSGEVQINKIRSLFLSGFRICQQASSKKWKEWM